MDTVIDPTMSAATSAQVGIDGTGDDRATVRAYLAGFGLRDERRLDLLTERFMTVAAAEQVVGAWFTQVFGGDVVRADLTADIGRLAALQSGAFRSHPDWFLAEAELPPAAHEQLRRAMPEPPTVSLMTPMPTQSLARLSFTPNARRALARLQIRRA